MAILVDDGTRVISYNYYCEILYDKLQVKGSNKKHPFGAVEKVDIKWTEAVVRPTDDRMNFLLR